MMLLCVGSDFAGGVCFLLYSNLSWMLLLLFMSILPGLYASHHTLPSVMSIDVDYDHTLYALLLPNFSFSRNKSWIQTKFESIIGNVVSWLCIVLTFNALPCRSSTVNVYCSIMALCSNVGRQLHVVSTWKLTISSLAGTSFKQAVSLKVSAVSCEI
jgi:hypothetical protein